MRGLIVYFKAFLLFISIQCIGYACIAGPNTWQRHDDPALEQKFYCIYQIINARFIAITKNDGQKVDPGGGYIKFAVAVIENRFIAEGILTDIKRASKGIQNFILHINKIESIEDYPNFGGNYTGKMVKIFSEIGIPASFQIGAKVSVVLRVSGDERGQTLFFVKEVENGPNN
ncbi:MAG: hypothetical protein NG747_02110 [Candidatus Brocadia sp.]|nr:hypothetical protein [Candidatus Brocadia sp.]